MKHKLLSIGAILSVILIITVYALSSCSDKLPEIRYGSVDFTIDNPEVLPLLREVLHGRSLSYYDLSIESVVGPYLYYYVDENSNISLRAGFYYIFDTNGKNADISLFTELFNEEIASNSDYIPDYNSDAIVFADGNIIGRPHGDFYYRPHVIIGNEYCTYIISENGMLRGSELYDFPNPPDGIEELVEDIANRYGDELFELAPEAREVPLELLNAETE